MKTYSLTKREFDVLVENVLKRGDSEAALRLSKYYGYSIGNRVKEMDWLEKAAAMGNATAIHNLKTRAQNENDIAEMRRKRMESEKEESSQP